MIAAMSKITLKSYILYSTIFGIFTESLEVKVGIALKMMYLIILVNYAILLAYNKIVIPRFLSYIVGYLLLSGIVGCFLHTDAPLLAIEQALGISVSILYFYNFYKYIDIDVVGAFMLYVKVAIYLAIIGIIIFGINMLLGNDDYRLQSLMLEPSHYCGVTLPAFYYLSKNYKQNKFSFFCLALSIVLSGSSVGYICVLFSIIIYNKRIFVFKNILIYATVCLMAVGLYFISDNVKLRVDDTLKSSESLDVTGANYSTYAIIANLFVTENVLEHSPIIGNGLGSHQLSSKMYLNDLIGIDTVTELQDLNSDDAASLTLRILSDLGILGICLVILFIYKQYTKDDELYVFSRAFIIYFFYKLFRDGHYFPPEMYFFVIGYYFLKLKSISKIKQRAPVMQIAIDGKI